MADEKKSGGDKPRTGDTRKAAAEPQREEPTPSSSKPKAETAVKDQAEADTASAAKAATQGTSEAIASAKDSNTVKTCMQGAAATASQVELSRFQKAMADCFAKYSDLKKWIDNNCDSLAAAVHFDVMKKKFDSFTTVQKVFIVLGILVVLALLRWATWALISYLWPWLIEFMSSDTGVQLMSGATAVVQTVNESGIVELFGASLLSGAEAQANAESAKQPADTATASTSTAAEEPAEPPTAWWDRLKEHPVEGLTAVINGFLAFLVRMLMGGGSAAAQKKE